MRKLLISSHARSMNICIDCMYSSMKLHTYTHFDTSFQSADLCVILSVLSFTSAPQSFSRVLSLLLEEVSYCSLESDCDLRGCQQPPPPAASSDTPPGLSPPPAGSYRLDGVHQPAEEEVKESSLDVKSASFYAISTLNIMTIFWG